MLAHIIAKCRRMGGVHPIFCADENEFPVVVEMLYAFQDEYKQIIAETVEIAIPQVACLQLRFQFGFYVLPAYVGRIPNHDIIPFCRRDREEASELYKVVACTQSRVYLVSRNIGKAMLLQLVQKDTLAARGFKHTAVLRVLYQRDHEIGYHSNSEILAIPVFLCHI